MEILLDEKCIRKSENYFYTRFRTLRIFWEEKLNLTTFGWGGGRIPLSNILELRHTNLNLEFFFEN